ncbi:hypothetical protein [Agrobacterium sp. NPDC090283]|uniref:hypothetical protein n=1 Tax=Agrobacterium sp. NPDC090283 TaxID=3363920 RepID=UPI00383B6FF6
MVYVGLDVHAETIAVATADDGRNGDVRFYGTIENNADAVLRPTKRLSATGARPVFCYEAGPLSRWRSVRTDGRNAEMLARLMGPSIAMIFDCAY